MDESALDRVIAAFAAGKIVILLDDHGTGVMACAAEHTDAARVNDLALHARGLVCIGIQRERALALGLGYQKADRGAGIAYTVSIEATTGVSTGISAGDRARTIEVTIDPASGPADVVSPGHVFPVTAHQAGVLAARGPAEAVVDLAHLSGCRVDAGTYCQVLSESGDEATHQGLLALSETLGYPAVAVREIAARRTVTESLVRQIESGDMPTQFGDFNVSVWEELIEGRQHVLLSLGDHDVPEGTEAPLVRVHSQCLTGDAFKSHRCDCGAQLEEAMKLVKASGCGAVLYLRQEGRGIGLVAKLKAYELQDRGRDTVEANEELGYAADAREYGIGAQILDRAGYRRLRLLTNNPRKIRGLEAVGITVEERIPLEIEALDCNRRYLQAKKDKLGHLLEGL